MLTVTAAATVAPAAVAAAPQHNPKGRFLGVVKSTRASARAAPQAQSQAQLAAGDLRYHGGPVMHSNRTHAIYWEPSGFSTTATYKSLINAFLTSVAADSGKHSNVYASDAQYTDGSGNAAYSSTFAGSLVVHDPYPASGCTDPGTTICLTDLQIQAEVNQVIAANGLPRGLGDIYFVITPQGVGGCFDANPADGCAYVDYCAYHSSFGSGSGETLYANQPYGEVSGCDSGEQPNGDAADSTINLISHEHNETITDPRGDAWFATNGDENGDKCVWDFGTALGSTGSGQYNQLISGAHYYLQREWSNDPSAHGCVLTMPNHAPTASFTSTPPSPTTGQAVSFNGSASSDSDGTIAAYGWDYGDGATATGATPSHTYATAGTYAVKLTVTDNDGSKSSVTHNVVVADRPPVASFTFTPGSPTTGQAVSFDGGGSSDPDGTVTGYSWDYGDGASGTGATPSHTYATAGTYTVTLTVTDNNGKTGASSQQVIVADRPPVAAFTFGPPNPTTGQGVSFDGSTSSDPDGTVTGYSWDFGDGATGTGATPSPHPYASAGTYTVTLTVTDNNGKTAQTSRSVVVSANAAPSAAFGFKPASPTTGQAVAFDGTASSDSDGTVNGYAWSFGDGATDNSSGATASHTYAHAGTYTVTLTVTDSDGGTGSATQQVTVTDRPPVAAFDFSPASPGTGQPVAFDASGSNDVDGTVTGYSWDFGDGATDSTTGAKPSHSYATPGTKTVKLVVTDDSGSTDTITHDVVVAQSTGSAPPAGGGTTGGGQAPIGAGSQVLGSPPTSMLGALPAPGARLVIPAQQLSLSSTRSTGVLVRCGAGRRCSGTLTLTATVLVPAGRGTRVRTVVLGRARFSVAALHSVTVRFHLARLASTLLNGHRRIRVRAAAVVTNAVAGRASMSRSAWLTRASTARR